MVERTGADRIKASGETGFRLKNISAIITAGNRAKRRAVAIRSFGRGIALRFSSRLTRRIILLNLGGLLALLFGFLYLNQFRQGLIDSRIQSLQTQSEIIAAAIAASATVDADAITIDPEKLLKLTPGQSYGVSDETAPALEFSINPDRVGPLLRRLVSPTRTRARIYDRDGSLLMDSRSLAARSNILRFDLPAQAQADKPQWWQGIQDFLRGGFNFARLPIYQDIGAANGKGYPEVANALEGRSGPVVRRNMQGETVISVATPIQRFRTIRGALLLSTQGGDIDAIIASERRAIFRIFLVSAAIMVLLSAALAGAIAEPIRRLATAAESVRRGVTTRAQIPDFTSRNDEIGHLSGALRDMTTALLNRMEAIERFAADVAHELKNPLTSLRSAVETLPIARTEDSRKRLLDVIQHDVKRLDRLISDISDASRLDAELARDDLDVVNLSRLLRGVVDTANQIDRNNFAKVLLVENIGCENVSIMGHESRLGQVFNNLIDNAKSFSINEGRVTLSISRAIRVVMDGQRPTDGYNIVCDDEGPGIPAHAFERIFERFYTDRPNQSFGNNSGLGLSISRQIVEAHGGFIRAENRLDSSGNVVGARFTVFFPESVE